MYNFIIPCLPQIIVPKYCYFGASLTFIHKLEMQYLLYMRVVSAEYDDEIRPTLHAKKSGVLIPRTHSIDLLFEVFGTL